MSGDPPPVRFVVFRCPGSGDGGASRDTAGEVSGDGWGGGEMARGGVQKGRASSS